MTTIPRGLRSNNPGNIEYNGTRWQGLDSPPSDGRFCRFTQPEYGIRALCRLLLNYQKFYGLKTVRGIISRFAPSNENDTESYIRAVCAKVGVGPDEGIDLWEAERMRPMVKGITKHENGFIPYNDDTIDAGMRLAGIKV